MFFFVVIAVLLAVSSTFFVHPWFVKSVFLKKHSKKMGFYDTRATEVKGAIEVSALQLLVVLAMELSMLFTWNVRRDYHSLLSVLVMVFLFQTVNQLLFEDTPHKKRKTLICLAFMVICAFIPLQNAIVVYTPPVEAVTVSIDIPQQNDISERLFASSAEVNGTTYSNSNFLLVLPSGSNEKGVAIFNKPTFIPCKYDAGISAYVRDKYPIAEIMYIGATLDDITPYAQYIVLKRSNIFAKPELDFYTFLNLQTGEFNECKELPDFATK